MLSWFNVFAIATGCVVVKEPQTTPGAVTGEVEVSWQVGSAGCAASGVTEIDVQLGGVGGTYDCLAESAVLTAPAGSYPVTLTGIDAGGTPRYGGESTVTVIGGQRVAVPTIVLGALPARVTASWYFENGRLCSQNGVDQIDMTIFEDDFIVDNKVGPCDEGELTIEEVQTGAYIISLLGRDLNGSATYLGEAQVTLEKGDDKYVEVMLVAQ